MRQSLVARVAGRAPEARASASDAGSGQERRRRPKPKSDSRVDRGFPTASRGPGYRLAGGECRRPQFDFDRQETPL